MKKLFWIAASLFLVGAGAASAHPRLSMQAEADMQRIHTSKHITSEVGEPRARIRSRVAGEGMTPLAFAQWISLNPGLVRIDRVALKRGPDTALLNRTAPFFMQADADRDGRISALEMADFVSGPFPTRLQSAIRLAQKNTRAIAEMAINP